MIGLRAMQHEDGRAFLREARAGRVAQANKEGYRDAIRDELTLLGLK